MGKSWISWEESGLLDNYQDASQQGMRIKYTQFARSLDILIDRKHASSNFGFSSLHNLSRGPCCPSPQHMDKFWEQDKIVRTQFQHLSLDAEIWSDRALAAPASRHDSMWWLRRLLRMLNLTLWSILCRDSRAEILCTRRMILLYWINFDDVQTEWLLALTKRHICWSVEIDASTDANCASDLFVSQVSIDNVPIVEACLCDLCSHSRRLSKNFITWLHHNKVKSSLW